MNNDYLPQTLILRGVVALLFAAATLWLPGLTLLSVALLVGAYLCLDGVSSLLAAYHHRRRGKGWERSLFEGILGVGGGVLAILLPGITLLVLTAILVLWATMMGASQVFVALRAREAGRGARALLGLAGALAIALGVLMIARPAIGQLTLLVMVSTFALVYGATLIALGFQLRREALRLEAGAPPEAGREQAGKAA